MDNLDCKNNDEFFIDSTFKIIPPQYRPYKLLEYSGIPKKEENPTLICFILIKFFDENAYARLFNFLIENYNFKPKFLMTDFDGTLKAAIKKNNYKKNNTIHLKCLFHFSQMLIRKLSNLGLKKKKLNKKAIEIIRNIQILIFLKKEKIYDFEKIILNELIN